MHIAVIDFDRCHPKKCNNECQYYCPQNRIGTQTVVFEEDEYPKIYEELCVGCGICIHKCPYGAIKILSLPETLKKDLVHQYSENGFRIYKLPAIKKGKVIGLIGQNGVGKTTALNILSGTLIPNFGDFEHPGSWDKVFEHYSGSVYAEYFKKVSNKKLKVALKPQYVDNIPKKYQGSVNSLLRDLSEKSNFDALTSSLNLNNSLNRNIEELSGGELQSLAIAVTLLKDADVYFFDEPSSYLDIAQRLNFAKILKTLAEQKSVYVIEHDLAIIDFLADELHILYGDEGAYGIVSNLLTARHGINSYLEGYIREQNMRFRNWSITFSVHPPISLKNMKSLISWENLKKEFLDFKLGVSAGSLATGQVVGVVGQNMTGKTTFVKMLAGVTEPTEGAIDTTIKVSYKPQYIKFEEEKIVEELYKEKLNNVMEDNFYRAEIENPLKLKMLMDKPMGALSGGELQRVAIGLTLAMDAELYLIDEPSAYLDSAERISVAKIIKRVIEKNKKTALVVDHDVYFLDLISDSLLVFSGIPGREGESSGPYSMREGMNLFLKSVNVTFRRDEESKRPRINKLGSYTDREQKEREEYYYD
jgi:ATP-binding cassette subfamily E protein 1